MYEQVEKPKENKSRSVANSVTQKKSNGKQGFGFVDNRVGARVQSKHHDDGLKIVQQCSVGTKVVQRQLLPMPRHREIVVDAAKRLKDPIKAKDTEWLQAIYKEFDGEKNPGAKKCVKKLIEQRLIDQNDWDLIEADFKLYRTSNGKGLEVHERHNTPRVHAKEEADKWVASLIINRIDVLYSGLPGFDGHARQVQLSITSLGKWYKEGKFSKQEYEKYTQKIIFELTKGKRQSNFAIPKYTYTFEDYKVAAI